jgi:hypothetical protein
MASYMAFEKVAETSLATRLPWVRQVTSEAIAFVVAFQSRGMVTGMIHDELSLRKWLRAL